MSGHHIKVSWGPTCSTIGMRSPPSGMLFICQGTLNPYATLHPPSYPLAFMLAPSVGQPSVRRVSHEVDDCWECCTIRFLCWWNEVFIDESSVEVFPSRRGEELIFYVEKYPCQILSSFNNKQLTLSQYLIFRN